MPLPDFVLPKFIQKINAFLPSTPPQLMFVTILNQMLKKEVLPADMTLLAGKRFEISSLDAGIKLRFSANEDKFIADSFSGEPDLRLAANTVDFARMMLLEEDPDTLFFNRKLQIEGDTELGLIVKNLLDSVDWQETPLSYVINH